MSQEKNEILKSVKKFEDMMRNHTSDFFDVSELEDIIDFYLDGNNFKGASVAAKFALKLYPTAITIQQRICEILIDKGHYRKAQTLLDRLCANNPQDAESLLLKGEVLLHTGGVKEALKNLRQGYELSDETDKGDAAHRIGILLERADRCSLALPFLEQALSVNPDDKALFYDLGFCHGRLDNFEKSIYFYELFLDEYPFSEQAWYNLGVSCYKMNLLEKAMEAYDYVIAIDQKYASAYFNKAGILADLGRYEESTGYYKQFIALDQDNAFAYSYIGENYEVLGDIEVAGEYFKFASEHSANGYLKLRYSAYLFSVGKYQESLPVFVEGWQSATEDEREGFSADFREMMEDPAVKRLLNQI